MNVRFATFIFWAFCFVVFSKVAWYDLRVYMDVDQRRDFVRLAFAVWVLAQGAVWLVVAIPMLRQFNLIAAVWVALVAPYFILGLMNGNFGTDYIGDAARYGLPLGYLLFGLLMFRILSLRTVTTALIASLAFWMVARTLGHILIADRTIRYGIQWEVFLPALLIPLAVYLPRGRVLVLAVLVLIVAMFAFGLTRALIVGTILAAGVCGLIALFSLAKRIPRSFALGAVSAIVIALCAIPMFVPIPGLGRLGVDAVFEDALPLNEAAAEVEIDLSERERTALARWETAIASNSAGMGTRIAEAEYFLVLAHRNWQSMLLGSGAGASHSVTTANGFERIVRAPHVTYAMVVYRHGYALGIVMILLLAFYGVPHHIRALQSASNTETRVIFTGLLAYRGALLGMIILHQGLIDDPIVFFSMALASAVPSSEIQI